MTRTRRLAPLVGALAALTLTACSPGQTTEEAGPATPAAEESPSPALAEDGEDGAEHTEPATQADTPQVPTADLPDVPAATGDQITNDVIALNAPADFTAGESNEGVQFYDGGIIPESASEDGSQHALAGLQLHPAATYQWDGTYPETEQENVTQTVYPLTIEGADAAAMEFTEITEGTTQELQGGDTFWLGPQGTATILVAVGDQLSRVVLHTSPGQAGVDLAASVAKTLIIN